MLDKKFVPQFNITLRCTMYDLCPYCYIKEQRKKFPLDMTPSDFDSALGWFMQLGADEIILLGGEPTMHPRFAEFLAAIEKHGLLARLFTNGIFDGPVASLIAGCRPLQTLFFHYDDAYLGSAPAARTAFLANLRAARDAGKRVWLRWNIDRPDCGDAGIIALAKEFSASIGYSITVPTQNNRGVPVPEVRSFAATLIHLGEAAAAEGIRIEPARALPLCAFTTDDRALLARSAHLQGTCRALDDLTVNTDLTVQLCSVTAPLSAGPVRGLDDLKEKIGDLARQEDELRKKPAIAECAGCGSFKDGSCQGGCYSYKLYPPRNDTP
jgi:hypothetical protein